MRHGAKVYLCKGQDGREEFGANAYWGNMHMKAVVLDGRVAYSGSANLTRSALFFSSLTAWLQGEPW